MNEQRKQNQTNRRCKILVAVIALCCAISLLGDFAAWVIQKIGGFSFPIRNAATIGIIGGADGPTAIFVTAAQSPGWQIILKILVLTAAILVWHCLNRRK